MLIGYAIIITLIAIYWDLKQIELASIVKKYESKTEYIADIQTIKSQLLDLQTQIKQEKRLQSKLESEYKSSISEFETNAREQQLVIRQKTAQLTQEYDIQKQKMLNRLDSEIDKLRAKKEKSLRQELGKLRTDCDKELKEIRIKANNDLNKRITAEESKLCDLESEIHTKTKELKNKENHLLTLEKEKCKGFPHLAEAYREFIDLKYNKVCKELENKKPAAPKASEEIKGIKEVLKEETHLRKVFEYKYLLCLHLAPFLEDFIDVDDKNDNKKTWSPNDSKSDPSSNWLSRDEFTSLDINTRSQLALDRYQKRNKSRSEIGKDFERYVGYGYEQDGYDVQYIGITEGVNDLGRDIIATRDNEVRIIQCKYWSKHKTIHEKHVFQLFGTTVEYWHSGKLGTFDKYDLDSLSNLINDSKVIPIFSTKTTLSERARSIANLLGIKVEEQVVIGSYPMIKCNIGKNNEKIYHLPFDQQYDKIKIDKKSGEFFASTVEEAVKAGFRRAKKWIQGAPVN